jgi:hypothetical protein
MKRTLITATLILVGSQMAIAQNTVNAPNIIMPPTSKSSPNPQRINEAQTLLNQYNTQYRNSGIEGRKMLDGVHATGLGKTADNVKSIRSLLTSAVSNDEKVALARILGSLYTPDDITGMNNVIAQDLKREVYSGQKEVARAGMLAYSRLNYFPDSGDVLLYAKNNGVIDTETYYGELAHLVPYAPANDQFSLVAKIKEGNSPYATEILAFITKNPEVMKKVYPETQKAILATLQNREPKFAQALGEFGLIDAIRYSTWLHSVAVLDSANSNVRYEDAVLSHLNDQWVDPRKIMAFLLSAEGKALIKSIGQSGRLDKALERISLYSKQLPQNIIMRDIVLEVAGSIRASKSP